jgi:hypothetical protein
LSELDEAKRWYECQRDELGAIHEWMRTRPEVPKPLLPLVRDYFDKKQGPERFKAKRQDLQRIALIRLFSGFETDFKAAFSAWLKASLDRAHAANGALRKELTIDEALPESIKARMDIFRALEPRLSTPDFNWFTGLREYRNNVIHRGFSEVPKEDPLMAHATLRRILGILAGQ